MKYLQTLRAQHLAYLIRIRGRTITFIWSSSPNKPLRSSIDLKIRNINPIELAWLAKRLNCIVSDDKIIIPDLNRYNRLLIYACVRMTIRNLEKTKKLAECVLEINSWDAHYWASKFREVWWNSWRIRNVFVIAKAFKLFFQID